MQNHWDGIDINDRSQLTIGHSVSLATLLLHLPLQQSTAGSIQHTVNMQSAFLELDETAVNMQSTVVELDETAVNMQSTCSQHAVNMQSTCSQQSSSWMRL